MADVKRVSENIAKKGPGRPRSELTRAMENAFPEKTKRSANDWASLTRAKRRLENDEPELLAYFSATTDEIINGAGTIHRQTLLARLGRFPENDIIPIAQQIVSQQMNTANGLEYMRAISGKKPDAYVSTKRIARLADQLLVHYSAVDVARMLRDVADMVESDT